MNTPIFRKCLFALVAALTALSPALAAEPMPPLASAGKAAYSIVVGRDASDAELLAVAELSMYLGRVTGTVTDATLKTYYGNGPIAEGCETNKNRCIYLGWTEFAKANGLDGATMKPEEWAVKTVGTNLILTGGRPRGTLYAVYDFLQSDCGVHWFDRDTEVVPKNPGLAMPQVERRGKPQMWFRYLGENDDYKKLPVTDLAAQIRFEVRNRCPGRLIPFLPSQLYGIDPWNYCTDLGSPIWNQARYRRDGAEPFSRHCHSYMTYVPPSEFYAKHPEYYGYTRENAPKQWPYAADSAEGKLCLTNPEVRKIVAERLRGVIRQDRVSQRSFGVQAPRFYDLSMMDSATADTKECPCPTCREFVKTHGRESDLLIDFVNAAAAAVALDYPDVTIATLAYYYNMLPPMKVKPRDNVLVEFCNWGGAPDGGPYLDQALTHPDNKWRLEAVRGWQAMGARLGIWDYLHYGNSAAAVPVVLAPVGIANNQLFHELGVEWFFECSERGAKAPWVFENFVSLRTWMTCQLMADPTHAVSQLLNTFFAGYFGPASGKMREYYDLLVQCQEKPRGKKQLSSRAATLDYLTPEFYTTAQRLLDEADNACVPDSGEQLRVRQERLRLDLSLLELWSNLERQLPDGVKLPFNRAAVIDRFEANAKTVLAGRSWSDKAVFTKELAREIAYYRNPRLPEAARGMDSRELCDITPRYFVPWHLCYPKANESVDDSATGYGKAMRFKGEPGWTSNPVEFKLADLTYTVKPADFPRDGQYHFYKLGRTRLLGKDQNLRIIINGKVSGGLDLGSRVNRRDSAAEWNVQVEAKLVGPSFAPGSGPTDVIDVGRILLIRAEPGFTRPEAERKALAEDISTTLINAQAANMLCKLPLTWKFRPDPKNEGEAAKWFETELDNAWADIRVDESWTTQPAGKDFHGTAWYSLTFTAPPVEKKGVSLLAVDLPRFFLLFGAVDGQCWIWLDGKPVGSQLLTPNIMWNKPFALDLGSELVKPGQAHRLVVKVKKDSNAAGIWKPVELRVK